MCEERRATIGRSDMSGKTPARIWNVNLSNVQFGLVLICGLLAIMGVVVTSASTAISWMHESAESHIQYDLRREVQPPAGIIYEATKKQILERQGETNLRMIEMEKKQIRIDVMVETIYEKITGRKAPREIDG